MPISLPSIGKSLPFSRLFRQLEQQVETVVKVLQPGPFGIVEHNYTADEIRNAKATVRRAVANWRRNADMEKNNPILKDFVN